MRAERMLQIVWQACSTPASTAKQPRLIARSGDPLVEPDSSSGKCRRRQTSDSVASAPILSKWSGTSASGTVRKYRSGIWLRNSVAAASGTCAVANCSRTDALTAASRRAGANCVADGHVQESPERAYAQLAGRLNISSANRRQTQRALPRACRQRSANKAPSGDRPIRFHRRNPLPC